MKKFFFAAASILLLGASIHAKKTLDHDAFDSWQRVSNSAVSNSGEWCAYLVNPQEGDGMLTFYNTRTDKTIAIPRGSNPKFTADSHWAVASISPLFADTRKAKIDKKKDFDMPQDSLAIIDLKTGKIDKIPNVINFKLGKEGGTWIAYQSCDTTHIKPAALKDKKAGKPLVILDLKSRNSRLMRWINSYTFSNDGSKLAVTVKKQKKDSVTTDGCGVILLPDTSLIYIDRDKMFYGTPVFDESGKKLAYTASNDSTESGTLKAELFFSDLTRHLPNSESLLSSLFEHKATNLALPNSDDPDLQKQLEERRANLMAKERGKQLFVNQFSTPLFSYNGKRLIVGVAPYVAPDDTTIVSFERAELDIWRWDAPYTPPQEKKMLQNLRKKTFPVAIDLSTGHYELLTSNPLVLVQPGDRWDADWALLRDPSEHIIEHQWDYSALNYIRLINVNTGEIKNVGDVGRGDGDLSPMAKYVLWFSDRNYYTYNVATGEIVNISKDVPYPVWNETDDHPMQKEPWGMAGWGENDNAVIIYDKYDLWSLDPDGKRDPINLTKGYGRQNNLKFRNKRTDPDHRFFKKGDEMLLLVFNYENKYNGFATLTYGNASQPKMRLMKDMSFNQILKAKNSNVFSFTMSNFSTSPNVYYVNGYDFAKYHRMSNANPQMAEYNWGTAELVKWYAYDGQPSEGVLYKPEDFDPNKKYPMLCVFYETNSENLYRHYTMEPSWSWVNYPFYVSRGYVVFVPDIHYTAGVPGECAYNYVCSGVEDLCKKYSWIDKAKIGIDGQSWGGYQTAYLVTRTNMFACAGSGAPVANMTSAFGGIRWGSGDSRQAQYEQGQSRIGRNLWDAPELYIANSPLFHANRCNTPLLIMHNDNDGAVPWYQGIELFMALRRLHKPVWMLQYNGEDHNLIERKNRKDITIRLQQFFDHYLKDAPMPDWMIQGIPMTRKGQEMGTGFTIYESNQQ